MKLLAFFSKHRFFNGFTRFATRQSARLNLRLNKPKPAQNTTELAKTWQQLMPPDGQEYFKISEVTEDTAYVEIHLHCPLRDTGKVDSCYKLMNYDRTLMDKVGGELVVLESQSNSGKPFCRLAIRAKGQDLSDLVPAHLQNESAPS
ncbi:MAG: hypothetical protein AAF570_14845 [Bacteroidota bacterium]